MSLGEELTGMIPQEQLQKVPRRFDIIGDIAVLSIPQELDEYKEEIAYAITNMMGNVKTVLNKVSTLEGEHRVAEPETIAGQGTVTTHRENGFAYRMDLKKAFFNPRLAFERRRVASCVKPGEDVLVPFSGVGPFAIPVAAAGANVLAVEINTEACRLFRENCGLNRVAGQVRIINGDASSIPGMVRKEFDRAIIPTPYGMDHFLESTAGLVKKGGYLHFYTFKAKEQISGLVEDYMNMGYDVDFHRRCGNVAPGISRWVFDLKKR